jgi:hypothetical protein
MKNALRPALFGSALVGATLRAAGRHFPEDHR